MNLTDLFKNMGDMIDAKIRQGLDNAVAEVSLEQVIHSIVNLETRLSGIENHLASDEDEDEDEKEDECPCAKSCESETEKRVHNMIHRVIDAINSDKQFVGATAMTMLIVQYFKEAGKDEAFFLNSMKAAFENYK